MNHNKTGQNGQFVKKHDVRISNVVVKQISTAVSAAVGVDFKVTRGIDGMNGKIICPNTVYLTGSFRRPKTVWKDSQGHILRRFTACSTITVMLTLGHGWHDYASHQAKRPMDDYQYEARMWLDGKTKRARARIWREVNITGGTYVFAYDVETLSSQIANRMTALFSLYD